MGLQLRVQRFVPAEVDRQLAEVDRPQDLPSGLEVLSAVAEEPVSHGRSTVRCLVAEKAPVIALETAEQLKAVADYNQHLAAAGRYRFEAA